MIPGGAIGTRDGERGRRVPERYANHMRSRLLPEAARHAARRASCEGHLARHRA